MGRITSSLFASLFVVLATSGAVACSAPAPEDGSDESSQDVVSGESCDDVSFATSSVDDTVVVSDFDRDGRGDLAIAGAQNGTIRILFQGMGASFGRTETLDTRDTGVSALASDGWLRVGMNASVFTFGGLRPDSDPSKLTQHHEFGGGNVASIAIGDVDGDGVDDLVAGVDVGIGVLRGAKDGSLGAAKRYNAPTDGAAVTLADFDGDGHLDVILANPSLSSLTYMHNDGRGGFERGVFVSTAKGPRAIVAADVNGDGKTDVLTATSSGSVSVLLGDGRGGFAKHVDYPAGRKPIALRLVKKMIVVANGAGDVTYGTLAVNPNGTLGDYAAGRSLGPAAAMTTADIVGDGGEDLVVLGSRGKGYVLASNSDGTFGRCK